MIIDEVKGEKLQIPSSQRASPDGSLQPGRSCEPKDVPRKQGTKRVLADAGSGRD